jgi:hypothetical protein
LSDRTFQSVGRGRQRWTDPTRRTILDADSRKRTTFRWGAPEPTDMEPVTMAVRDDTCGNLIQIAHLVG